MEELKTKYPEVVPYIENLPPHMVEKLGSVAIGISHEDMHPKEEVIGKYGRSELATDFSKVITDPEYDSSLLSDEAMHAAKLGKEQVADIVLTTSKILHGAHESLVSGGFKFGASELETDEDRSQREQSERDTVYDAASTRAIEVARAAKESGDAEAAVKALETILVLHSIRGGESRKAFREAVRGGLSDELLTAVQSTNRLFTNDGGGKTSLNGYDISSGVKILLEMTTGKILDENFVENGELDPRYLRLPFQDEDLRDAVAALTSKNSQLRLDKDTDVFSGSVMINNIRDRYKPDAAEGEVGSKEYFYQLVEGCADSSVLNEAFKCTDPKQAIGAADKLGIPVFQVVGDFGRQMDDDVYSPKQLDSEAIDQMLELKLAHPRAFTELVNDQLEFKSKRSGHGGDIGYSPADVSKALDKLGEAGVELLPGIAIALTNYEDKDTFIDKCVTLVKAFQKAGVEPDQITNIAEKSDLSLSNAIYQVGNNEKSTVAQFVEKLVLRAEIVDAYGSIYSKLEYPLKSFRNIEKPEFDAVPHLKKRMLALGLPEDVSSAMFDSWKTYDAFTVAHFHQDSFNLPGEAPSKRRLDLITKEQAKALETQLESLEDFIRDYGLETTHSVVETFGIYNFSRYDAVKLAQQNEDWKSGSKISSVVVNARYDWNSFTGKQTVFGDELGEGVFHFEANSGRDTARVAVMVGQHERSNGREPDIKRFVVHAHANPEGLVMGVNHELISTDMYLKSASNATKIGASEINDYKKHLGGNFEVILQGCSTAGEVIGGKNIALTMSERHSTRVEGSNVSISGVTILADGSVRFKVNEGNGLPIIYLNGGTQIDRRQS